MLTPRFKTATVTRATGRAVGADPREPGQRDKLWSLADGLRLAVVAAIPGLRGVAKREVFNAIREADIRLALQTGGARWVAVTPSGDYVRLVGRLAELHDAPAGPFTVCSVTPTIVRVAALLAGLPSSDNGKGRP